MAGRPASLLTKLRRYFRLQREIRVNYKLLDEIEPEIIQALQKRGKPLRMGRNNSQAAKLVDNYEEKNKVFRAHGISRYEIQLTDAT